MEFPSGGPAISTIPSVKFPTAPRDRVAVASYPFREFIVGTDHKNGNPAIELKDFAGHLSEKFGVRKIEPWSAHFPSINPNYLGQLRTALDRARGTVVNIAVDGNHCPYASDRAERDQAIAFSKKWIDVAVAIGSPSVRTNIPIAKGDAKPNLQYLADSLRNVVEHAAAKATVVHLENDNPLSEDPFFLAQLVEQVGSPWLRLLPDFCNTLAAHDEDYAYRAMDAMFAHGYGICHVKDSEVNGNGETVHVDLARTFEILKRHSYKGYCSIEYDAPGDPYKATADLIEKTERYLA
jgi:sugar phosphate isomerase/epimerase